MVELGVLAVIFVSALNFCIGRALNRRLAMTWLHQVDKVLIASFSFIPEECKSEDGSSLVSFEDATSSQYPIAFSGRETLKYASFTLVTKARHDIAKSLFTSLPFVNRMFPVQRDALWVEMPIERPGTVHSEILFVQQRELEAV